MDGLLEVNIIYNRNKTSIILFFLIQSIGRPGTWRSNSMDVLPYVESDNDYQYPPGSTLAKLSQLSQLAQQQQQLNKHGASAAAVNHKMSMMR